MKNEKKELQSSRCIWYEKNQCNISDDVPCPSDCDLKTLRFDKDAVIERMRQEEKNIHDLKRQGMFRNREKIKDKVMGIYILQKVLKETFDYNASHVVDSDVEKMPKIGGLRLKKVK